jgi:predicted RNase H-like nuclease (RuvC/YqgF family)
MNVEGTENIIKLIPVECIKASFKDEETAMKYIKKLQATSKRDRIPQRAYLCEKCSTWHLTSKPDYNKVETISKIEKIEPGVDVFNKYESTIKQLTLELLEKNAEIEAMIKQLNKMYKEINKMYKEIYELNDTIKTLTKNGKKN